MYSAMNLVEEGRISFPLEQCFGNLGVPILACKVERSESRVVDAIDETIAVQENFDDVVVSVPRGFVQSCVAKL